MRIPPWKDMPGAAREGKAIPAVQSVRKITCLSGTMNRTAGRPVIRMLKTLAEPFHSERLVPVPEKYQDLYELAFGKRPAEELYDLRADPEQLNNVAGIPEYSEIRDELSTRLQNYTAETDDPRAHGKDAPWDYYPFYGRKTNKDWYVEKRTD